MVVDRHTTYGERHVEKLLKAGMKQYPSKFFYVKEPRIPLPDGGSSKPDFVIVLRERGVVILEIKDWVNLKKATQRDVQVIHKDGTPATYPNPIVQAERYAKDLTRCFEERQELLEVYRNRRKIRFPWQLAVALPNIQQNTVNQFIDAGVWEPRVVLSAADLVSPAAFLKSLDRLPWPWKLEDPLDQLTLSTIRGVIDPQLIVERDGRDAGTLTHSQEQLVKELLTAFLPKQLVIDEFEPPVEEKTSSYQIRLLRGVAGSGKTLVLIHRARHLAKSYPNCKILVMTYNKDLTDHLQKQLPEIEVMNFDKLSHRIVRPPNNVRIYYCADQLRYAAPKLIKESGLSHDFVADEIVWRLDIDLNDDEEYLSIERKGRGRALPVEKRKVINRIFSAYRARQQQRNDYIWEEMPRLAYNKLMQEKHPLKASYDVILIDEAQDFAPTWIKLLKALLKPGGAFFICDDPTQSIFKNHSWREKGLEVVGHTKVLQIPFRNSRQISTAAHSIIAADPVLRDDEEITQPNMKSSELRDAPQPHLLICASSEQEMQAIEEELRELLESGLPAREIAILCHSAGQVKQWAHVQDHGIYVASFYKMKGLEFTAVFIPHLDSIADQIEGEDEMRLLRRRIFTAMTRARETLMLSACGQLPEILAPIAEHVW